MNKEHCISYVLFPAARHPLMGLGLLNDDVSRSHSDTPLSLGLLWTGDTHRTLPDHIQHSQQRNIYALGWIRTCNPSKRAAADSCGHWEMRELHMINLLYVLIWYGFSSSKCVFPLFQYLAEHWMIVAGAKPGEKRIQLGIFKLWDSI
jgi:hypothetical protein